ncbi:GrpB family protein [Georgenia wutianyii]|uniref:GrpB family protein n=1 Tax=Georgenia wutianyii TaxID=2585135 RepID=A0ABX5VRV6_9MICO|nr:GrpB family protein [Georgenia wutianyii]QDB79859.1 GrpB family protein [Georgenia wutianyii]
MQPGESVTLVPSRFEEWGRRFAAVAARLEALVPEAHVEHMGSTAVPGLPAKDVVDVLVGVAAPDVVPTARRLVAAGFDLEGQRDHHCWLSSSSRARREVVVHVVEHGGRAWDRRVAFRDLLREDAGARRAYLAVKERAASSAHGWDEYTQAKSGVVADLLASDGSSERG